MLRQKLYIRLYMKSSLYIFLLLLLLPGATLITQAQISTAPGTSYINVPNELASSDSIFLVKQLGTLILQAPENQNNFIYEWLGYNKTSGTWSVPLATGNISTYMPASEGGILLNIRKLDTNELLEQHRCWVFQAQINALTISIENDNCDLLELLASTETRVLEYFDTNGQQSTVSYPLHFEWQAETEVLDEHTDRLVTDAPTIDRHYSVKASLPALNLEVQSEDLAHTAIAVKANYSYESTKPDVAHEGHSEAEGSAPFELRFTDESEGPVSSWEWDFGGRTSVTRDPFHVFTAVGQDTVTLRVQSAHGCESIDNHLVVTITEMAVDAPNAFTPNNDGANDEFRVYYRSVRKFSMVIFNSWGRKVYESTDPSLGWDGTIGNQVAEPGVYFYVIEAEGYNPNEKKKLQGPVHLIRGK